ncbi:MAG TPA: hypothetical protein V6D19_21205 [Stenomitos sp.]
MSLASFAVVAGIALVGLWFAYPKLTYRGVPISILFEFIQDPIARNAYFSGRKELLHDRLKDMDIEAQIKAFYRPQIADEQELDRYIHELLYTNTGYIGNGYQATSDGQLVSKTNFPPGFWRWMGLAKRLQLAKDHETQDGVFYVITPKGTRVPYSVISNLYPINDMKKWLGIPNKP